MRTVLATILDERMRTDETLCILDADLARANGTLELHSKYPDRTFDVGVAEANMVCIAAGLASYGFKPIIFSFCPFITRRVCDQIAISVAYARMNVKFVGTDPGISAELNGGTHMSIEDIGIMRSIPDMVIFEPVDGDQLAKAMPQIFSYDGPLYIRLFRKPAPATLFAHIDYRFDLFTADLLNTGNDVTIFATGIEVAQAMTATEILSASGISAEVINVHTIKPIDTRTVIDSVRKTGCAVSCENHNILGGLGSALAECFAAEYPIPMEFIGLKDRFGMVGRMADLLGEFNINAQSITEAALKVIQRKK